MAVMVAVVVVFVVLLFQASLISHLLAELARYGTRDEHSTNRDAAAIIISTAHHQRQTDPSPNASRIPACVELSEREGANKVGGKGASRECTWTLLHFLVPQPSSAATPPLCEGSTQKHATPEGAIGTVKSKSWKPLKRQLSKNLGRRGRGP